MHPVLVVTELGRSIGHIAVRNQGTADIGHILDIEHTVHNLGTVHMAVLQLARNMQHIVRIANSRTVHTVVFVKLY